MPLWDADYLFRPDGSIAQAIAKAKAKYEKDHPMTTSQTPAWRLVPVEPTEAMLEAAAIHRRHSDEAGKNLRTSELYAVLLAASPAPELPAERARLAEQTKTQGWLVANAAGNWGTGDEETKKRVALLNADIDRLAALPAPTPQAEREQFANYYWRTFGNSAEAKAAYAFARAAWFAAPTPASVQPVAVRWEWRLREDGLCWHECAEAFVAHAKQQGYLVRALGVIDPTPAERVAAEPARLLEFPSILQAPTPPTLDEALGRLRDSIAWLRDGQRIARGIGVADMVVLEAALVRAAPQAAAAEEQKGQP